ncbi:hypothetical protein WCLP8_5030005 [uncultured Gammaproteobacteria bacterium]
MQVCSCLVRHDGEMNHVTFKPNVTVAEIVILRAIHGEDAIVDILPVNMDRRTHEEEVDRLARIYTDPVVKRLWSGFRPRLPATLKDIGISRADIEARAAVAAAKAEQMRAALAASNPEDEDETPDGLDADYLLGASDAPIDAPIVPTAGLIKKTGFTKTQSVGA